MGIANAHRVPAGFSLVISMGLSVVGIAVSVLIAVAAWPGGPVIAAVGGLVPVLVLHADRGRLPLWGAAIAGLVVDCATGGPIGLRVAIYVACAGLVKRIAPPRRGNAAGVRDLASLVLIVVSSALAEAVLAALYWQAVPRLLPLAAAVAIVMLPVAAWMLIRTAIGHGVTRAKGAASGRSPPGAVGP